MLFVGWNAELRFGQSTFISLSRPRKSISANLYVQFCFGIGDKVTVLSCPLWDPPEKCLSYCVTDRVHPVGMKIALLWQTLSSVVTPQEWTWSSALLSFATLGFFDAQIREYSTCFSKNTPKLKILKLWSKTFIFPSTCTVPSGDQNKHWYLKYKSCFVL